MKHVCECGCGEIIEIKREHYREGVPRFLKGHNFSSEYNPKTGKEIPPKKTFWDRLSKEEQLRRLSLLKKFPCGSENPNWVGGETITDSGYRLIRLSEHPNAKDGYVPEHRLVVETWMRENCPDHEFMYAYNDTHYLLRSTVVHHRDENKLNNVLENLILMRNQSTHLSWHMREDAELIKIEKLNENIFCPWAYIVA